MTAGRLKLQLGSCWVLTMTGHECPESWAALEGIEIEHDLQHHTAWSVPIVKNLLGRGSREMITARRAQQYDLNLGLPRMHNLPCKLHRPLAAEHSTPASSSFGGIPVRTSSLALEGRFAKRREEDMSAGLPLTSRLQFESCGAGRSCETTCSTKTCSFCAGVILAWKRLPARP